jgi:hypothetical protein
MTPNFPEVETRMAEVALQQLKRKSIVAEYERRSANEKPEFMMACAAYVLWLIMVGSSQTQKASKVNSIVGAIHAGFRTCDWYRAGLFESIWESIQDSMPTMRAGPQTGILIPLVHVIEAANRAGCHLDHTTELDVMIESSLMLNELPQIAAAAKPKRWHLWK